MVLYYGIVRNQKRRTTSTQGVLVGYGLVIPLSLWIPFQVINWLDIRNVGYRLGFGPLPLTVTLCSLEAMHGFVPHHIVEQQEAKKEIAQENRLKKRTSLNAVRWSSVKFQGKAPNLGDEGADEPATESSLSSYILHTGFLLRPKYDDKGRPIKSTTESFVKANKLHFFGLGIFTLLFHLTEPFDFFPFPSSRPSNETFVSLELGQMYNSFIQARKLNSRVRESSWSRMVRIWC